MAGIDFTDDVNFLFLAVGIAGLVSLAVFAIIRGTTGRFLDAVRGSEVGAASIGINPARQRLVAFIGAAGLAGLGGGLLASFVGQANYEASFAFFLGLVWVAVLVTMGVRSLAAAFVASISFYAMPKILNTIFSWPADIVAKNPDLSGVSRTVLDAVDPTWAAPLAFALFGLGALTYARHPEGILQHQTTQSVNAILRWTGRQVDDDPTPTRRRRRHRARRAPVVDPPVARPPRRPRRRPTRSPASEARPERPVERRPAASEGQGDGPAARGAERRHERRRRRGSGPCRRSARGRGRRRGRRPRGRGATCCSMTTSAAPDPLICSSTP